MNKKCLPLFHDYTNWEDITLSAHPNVSNIVGMPIYSSEAYEVDAQKRVCRRCGKKQQRIVK